MAKRKSTIGANPLDQVIPKAKRSANKAADPPDPATRQTYYVPKAKHKALKRIALEREINVSDLVIEGIDHILTEYRDK